MGGFIGFDYNSLFVLFKVYDIPEEEWCFYLDKVALLTSIASKYWNADKPKESKAK